MIGRRRPFQRALAAATTVNCNQAEVDDPVGVCNYKVNMLQA
jgi:hypothetical protein